MEGIAKNMNSNVVKQTDSVLREVVNRILGREIEKSDYDDFELICGSGMVQTVVYKGKKMVEIKTEITFNTNWSDFYDNSVSATATTTYRFL